MTKEEEKQRKSRRYYLHKKVREFTKVDARNRQVEVNDRILNSISDQDRKYLNELNSLGYNLQTFIE